MAADDKTYEQWAHDVFPQYAQKYGIDPNPDNPQHFYDYRKAYAAGIRAPDSTGHWPSEYKLEGNPRTYINLKSGEASAKPFDGATDTRTMIAVSNADTTGLAAKTAYIAAGIRKKYGDRFNLDGLSDDEVLHRHHARFGAGMSDEEYKQKLNDVYGVGFVPPKHEATLSESLSQLGDAAKKIGIAAIPFGIAEGAKLLPVVAKSVPGASQVGFALGHAVGAGLDIDAAHKLEKVAASIEVPDVDAKASETYALIQPQLAAKGWSDEDIKAEAQRRAEDIVQGNRRVRESLLGQAEERYTEARHEPARAAADAFFLGKGAPIVEGLLKKGLEKIGLNPILSRIAQHMATGTALGAAGLGIQGGGERGIDAIAANKPIAEIGHELVQGAIEGGQRGGTAGFYLGGATGGLEAIAGKIARPIIARAEAKAGQAAIDIARLQGWTQGEAKLGESMRAEARKAAIDRTADEFDPHSAGISDALPPSEAATSVIQQAHGDDAALSEAGLRAATQIEKKIRLSRDAEQALKTPAAQAAIRAAGGVPREAPPAPSEGAPLQPTSAPQPTTGLAMPEEQPVAPAAAPKITFSPEVLDQMRANPAMYADIAAQNGVSQETLRAAMEKGEFKPMTDLGIAGKVRVTRDKNVWQYVDPTAPSFNTMKLLGNLKQPEMQATIKGLDVIDGRENLSSPTSGKSSEPVAKAASSSPKLPQELAGAKPRYAYGNKQFKLTFDSDVDRALYITSQLTKSKRDADYRKFLGEQGFSPEEIKARGLKIRDAIKALAKAGKHGETLTIPDSGPTAPATTPRRVDTTHVLKGLDLGESSVSVNSDGLITLHKLGGPSGTHASTLTALARRADKHQMTIETRITQVPGPRGGKIPIEKMIPWYEKHGFTLVEGTKLPEGQYATATLRRVPRPKE